MELQKQIHGGKAAVQQMVLEQQTSTGRKEPPPKSHIVSNTDSKQIANLSVKHKTIKLKEKNIGKHLQTGSS